MSDGILSLDSAARDDVDCNLRRGVCQAEVFPHFGVRCVLRSSPIGFGGLDSIGPYTWAFGPVRTDAPISVPVLEQEPRYLCRGIPIPSHSWCLRVCDTCYWLDNEGINDAFMAIFSRLVCWWGALNDPMVLRPYK